MLNLPQVTLVALGSKNIEGMFRALEYSSRKISFGSVKLITEIECKTIDEWNHAIIYDLRKYIDTPFCLLVHPDGFVVNPESWLDEFLRWDYVGAPWPYPKDSYSYRDGAGNVVRVGNSVSLRSQKILNLPYELEFLWRSYYGNTNEDGFLCCHNRIELEYHGVKFAPIEVAKYFSRELDIPENADVDKPFCFHMHDIHPGRNEEFRYLL